MTDWWSILFMFVLLLVLIFFIWKYNRARKNSLICFENNEETDFNTSTKTSEAQKRLSQDERHKPDHGTEAPDDAETQEDFELNLEEPEEESHLPNTDEEPRLLATVGSDTTISSFNSNDLKEKEAGVQQQYVLSERVQTTSINPSLHSTIRVFNTNKGARRYYVDEYNRPIKRA